MEYGIKVYKNKSDVTGWVKGVTIDQIDSIHRKFNIVFAAWFDFDESDRWDIFETYDPGSTPRAEVVIRNGVIPEDRKRIGNIVAGEVPTFTAEGYEYIWLAKRRAPAETIVLVPSRKNVEQDVDMALKNFDGTVGTYRVWANVRTLHDAVARLMNAARIRVNIRIPDYDMEPYVIDPKLSYWKAVENLTDPFAPVKYYIRTKNTIVIADPTATVQSSRSTLNLPAGVVESMDFQPQRLRRIRRVILRKSLWR